MVDPNDVIHPKDRLQLIAVLFDGGEDSYSVALVRWKEETEGEVWPYALGIRWNGGPDPIKRRPQQPRLSHLVCAPPAPFIPGSWQPSLTNPGWICGTLSGPRMSSRSKLQGRSSPSVTEPQRSQ